jgi:hypothetical protein
MAFKPLAKPRELAKRLFQRAAQHTIVDVSAITGNYDALLKLMEPLRCPAHDGGYSGSGALRGKPTINASMPSLALVDNVVTAIDIQRVAGNQTRGIMSQECRGDSNIVNGNQASGRRLPAGFVEQLVEFGNA